MSKYVCTVESYRAVSILARGARLKIVGYASRDAMHKFLNTGDNAFRWRESSKGLKPGTYAWAGGQWHNVKNLDVTALAHI